MNTFADKTKKSKGLLQTSTVTQKQSHFESATQLTDNRPIAAIQAKLQQTADNSPRVQQAAQLQSLANNHSAQQHNPFQMKENTTGLPDNLKAGIEHLSGHSMDDVKVHYNSDKPAKLQAHAFAQGNQIHLSSGQEKHLPHEAWHVVQQKQGRVKPTTQMKGTVNINDDAGLEKEADIMGNKAIQKFSSTSSAINKASASNSSTLQLKPADWTGPGIRLNTTTLNIPPGWFSTWKKIKEEINKYKTIPKVNIVARKASLIKTEALIVEWKADKKHKATSTEQRVQNILAELPYVEGLIAEEKAEMTAEASEIADGGHSLTRHGPQLTNQDLENRLLTGIAPDNKISPAPGSSSKFENHKTWVSTKQLAATALKNQLDKVQKGAAEWNTKYNAGAVTARTAKNQYVKSPDDNVKKNTFFKDRNTLKATYAGIESDIRDETSLPLNFRKKINNLKKEFDTAAPFKPIPAIIIPAHTKDVGKLNTILETFNQYSVRQDHGMTVGNGVEKTGAANEITFDLEVLLNAIITWNGGPGWDTKTINTIKDLGTIKAALGAQHVPVAHNARDSLAKFFSKPANIYMAIERIKKHKKDVKIYDAVQNAVAPLDQTFTTFELNTRHLFTATNGHAAISPASWKTVQHYPAHGLGGDEISKGKN